MKKIIFIIIFLVIFILFTQKIFAESNYINDIIDSLELSDYDYEISKNITNSEKINFSFSDLVKKIITGDFKGLSIFNFFNYILNTLFQEIFINFKILKNIIIISILCAFLKALTDSFKNKGVGEIGFYTGYIVISMLLINSFNLVIDVLIGTVNSISNIINSLAPLLSGLLVMSGATASSAIFASIIIIFLNISTFIMNKLFIPLMALMIVLNIVNYITPKEVLNKLIEFLKWITTFGIRALAIIFTFILSFQRIASPIVNSTVNKVAKTAINFIPIIGDVVNGTLDGVMHFVGLIKGGIGIGAIVFVLIACLIPVLKLISFIIIYKVTAILIEPVSDKRITSSIDCLGEYTKMVLSTLFIFIILFILMVVIMLSISV